MSIHTDKVYMRTEPLLDDAELTCRTVAIRKARKQHMCLSLSKETQHMIAPGERYRYERALVDGDFWGEYRICLACLDKFIDQFIKAKGGAA
ncbi:hypothetical protein [Undibacterium curvum]|uniref:hypothetical protein n=1 Tax=Undibacterium curvum TaxID=2762294 RepID=UPI003D0D4747